MIKNQRWILFTLLFCSVTALYVGCSSSSTGSSNGDDADARVEKFTGLWVGYADFFVADQNNSKSLVRENQEISLEIKGQGSKIILGGQELVAEVQGNTFSVRDERRLQNSIETLKLNFTLLDGENAVGTFSSVFLSGNTNSSTILEFSVRKSGEL